MSRGGQRCRTGEGNAGLFPSSAAVPMLMAPARSTARNSACVRASHPSPCLAHRRPREPTPPPASGAAEPEQNVFYYDHDLKMWRERGAPPPPPPEVRAGELGAHCCGWVGRQRLIAQCSVPASSPTIAPMPRLRYLLQAPPPPPTTFPCAPASSGASPAVMPPPTGGAGIPPLPRAGVGSRYALAGSYAAQQPAAAGPQGLVPQPGGFAASPSPSWQQPATAASPSHQPGGVAPAAPAGATPSFKFVPAAQAGSSWQPGAPPAAVQPAAQAAGLPALHISTSRRCVLVSLMCGQGGGRRHACGSCLGGLVAVGRTHRRLLTALACPTSPPLKQVLGGLAGQRHPAGHGVCRRRRRPYARRHDAAVTTPAAAAWRCAAAHERGDQLCSSTCCWPSWRVHAACSGGPAWPRAWRVHAAGGRTAYAASSARAAVDFGRSVVSN